MVSTVFERIDPNQMHYKYWNLMNILEKLCNCAIVSIEPSNAFDTPNLDIIINNLFI